MLPRTASKPVGCATGWPEVPRAARSGLFGITFSACIAPYSASTPDTSAVASATYESR
jgi:hypothetical protein